MEIRVYIACSLRERERAAKLRDKLQCIENVKVTSNWINRITEGNINDPEIFRAIGRRNQYDMDLANVMAVLLSDHVKGTLVEAGYGVGKGLKTFIVGPYPSSTPMLDLWGTEWVKDEEAFINAIIAL